jgi:primosomal protein N' (replication factor Y)
MLVLARELPSLLERDQVFGRARRQRELYELLDSLGGRGAVEHLVERLGVSDSVVDGLVARGLARIEREADPRVPYPGRALVQGPAHPPTPAQRHAIARITSAHAGDVFLLHGVTGSGKTLVYLEALRHILADGERTGIVLVPEIALTPQAVDRFRAVFGDLVAVLHSALGDGERLDDWRALRRGNKRIALGPPSPLFAPLDNVGLIVVDEEHEASYKQGEAPRYHAREAAIVRAHHEGGVVVLGSATPSLESWVAAREGRYQLLSLPDRVGGGRLPAVHLVDLRRKLTQGALGSTDPVRRVVSEPVEAALRERMARGEQSLLLLNRRGYAAFLQCSQCGHVVDCPNCSISLTYHRTPERLICHYCAHSEDSGPTCSKCGGLALRQRGLGTQQVERLLSERFPEARIARMDVDTTSGKMSHSRILDRVAAGDVDILLGTQMIAKGLDFPNVTLVAVVDADVGINLPDFRASERCFQLLAQVAGRAGRGPKGGEVYIQTRCPEHHAVRHALTHDYLSFVEEELSQRAEPPYPPSTRLANIVFSGTSEESTAEMALAARDWLRRLMERYPELHVHMVGPAPCAIDRIKTRWRWHLMLKSNDAKNLTRVVNYLGARFPVPKREGLRIAIDRDPATVL